MKRTRTRGVGKAGTIARLSGIVCLALGALSCAADETADPLEPSAELTEVTSHKGWGGWKRTLRVDPESTTIETGATVQLTVTQVSGWESDESPTEAEANWFVLDREVVEIEGSARSSSKVILRALKPGKARIAAISRRSAAIARVWITEGNGDEEPDGEGGQGQLAPVAAVLSGPAPVLLVGDTVPVEVRPNLVDEDGVVIPTALSEWSVDFDRAHLAFLSDSLVTALAPTRPGSPTTVVLTHRATGFAVEEQVVILLDEDPGEVPNEPGDPVDVPTQPGEWPDNEPVGMTPVLMVDGSTKHWPSYYQASPWQDGNRVSVVNDPDSKHGKAIEKRFYVGDDGGWHGLTYNPGFGGHRELYFRIVFRLSPNWQWHTGMNKFFYWGGVDRPFQQGPTQFFLGGRGGVLEFVNQSTSGEEASRGNFRVLGAPRITNDVYHTAEVLHVANTPGQSNGSVRIWINGVEVERFEHIGHRGRSSVRLENLRWLDYKDPRLTGALAFMFWGGQNDTKRVNDWLRVSEFYIAGRQ